MRLRMINLHHRVSTVYKSVFVHTNRATPFSGLLHKPQTSVTNSETFSALLVLRCLMLLLFSFAEAIAWLNQFVQSDENN